MKIVCNNSRNAVRKKIVKPKNDSDRNVRPKENATFPTCMNGVPPSPVTMMSSLARCLALPKSLIVTIEISEPHS